MSLSLLMHLGLTEFSDKSTKRFSERSEWRSIVRRDEEFLLSWYYKRCSEHFEASASSKRLLFDQFHNDGKQEADD